MDYINTKIEDIATDLLGMIFVHQTKTTRLSGYIVDVEIYLGEIDKASHAYNGKKTKRMDAMYLTGGHLYLYQMRGHTLINIVCGTDKEPVGIMIRAIEPLEGIEEMERLRNAHSYNLTNGPAKVAQALDIDMRYYGIELGGEIQIISVNRKTPEKITKLPRIGIQNKEPWTSAPLRYIVQGNPYTSNIRKADIKVNNGWINSK